MCSRFIRVSCLGHFGLVKKKYIIKLFFLKTSRMVFVAFEFIFIFLADYITINQPCCSTLTNHGRHKVIFGQCHANLSHSMLSLIYYALSKKVAHSPFSIHRFGECLLQNSFLTNTQFLFIFWKRENNYNL